jgi:hypothetical protein
MEGEERRVEEKERFIEYTVQFSKKKKTSIVQYQVL